MELLNEESVHNQEASVIQFNPPKNAMSYFSLSLARHGKYGRRPKVEMPENTESAYWMLSRGFPENASSVLYLSPAITGQGIVPKASMRSFYGLLIMITMC
jgi:hypothetical protein